MSAEHNLPQAIYLVGPTAVGKTDLSIHLAKTIKGEIISADSRCLYRGMDIGTAKPSQFEQQQVPHFLIDVADVDEIWSLAEYKKQAIRAGYEIVNRGRTPIFVGGTGQYYRALVQGWSVPQIAPNPALRNALTSLGEEIGAFALHDKLTMLDPEAAKVNDPQNIRRTIRALEVILGTGRKFSSMRTKERPPFDFLVIGLARERNALFERVDLRIKAMINSGLIEEVKRLLTMGYSELLPSMSAIGYREMISYLNGEIELEDAIILMKRNTRSFIRRQANWFKPSDPAIHWISMSADPLDQILRIIYS